MFGGDEMNEVIEQIDITPDKTLYKKLGFSGYSFPQAIAELIDNALDEPVPDESLVVNVILGKNYIEIRDNGRGMIKAIAAKALVLGYSTKKEKLGEFGLGLKTACSSLGSKVTLIANFVNN